MAAPPTPDELGPLLGHSMALDDPAEPDGDTEGSEFEAAAMSAVGTREKAGALKDAITACLREHGLLTETDQDEADEDTTDDGGDVAAGFGDY